MNARSFGTGLLVGLATALAAAAALTLLVTVWEVVEKPGGIFRTEAGWRWDFVVETALSWFLPTLGGLAPVTALLGVLAAWRRARRT